MSIEQAHLEIAKQRFLEMMAEDPGCDAGKAADTAIRQADAFHAAYHVRQWSSSGNTSGKTKGCRACHGSGGKQIEPCKVCNGTGKVAA